MHFSFLWSDWSLSRKRLSMHHLKHKKVRKTDSLQFNWQLISSSTNSIHPLWYLTWQTLLQAPAKRCNIWMQHLLPTWCCVVWPPMLQCATFVARCCMKFEKNKKCCTVQHEVTSFGRVLQHLLHARMRIASYYSMVTIEITSLVCFQFFFDNADKCCIWNVAAFCHPGKFTFADETNVAQNVASFGQDLEHLKVWHA